jgi:microcystin-dependent protein
MSTPYLGEIRLFAFGFPPRGWLPCDGRLLSINVNQALFSLLGFAYGGDGRTTFALPDLRGRIPVHFGVTPALGTKAGVETHALTVNELPSHSHPVVASSMLPNRPGPAGNMWANGGGAIPYADAAAANATMAGAAVTPAGGGQAHPNLAPFLVLNFCIAVQGIFPSPS